MCGSIWTKEETTRSTLYLQHDATLWQIQFIISCKATLTPTTKTRTTKSGRKGSMIGPHRLKVRVQRGGDVSGCKSSMSVSEDVTALAPVETHTHSTIYRLLISTHTQSCDRIDLHKQTPKHLIKIHQERHPTPFT